jgi:hypothetical protein
MKFKDIFLPKIARSDPEIRKQAVLEEFNLELLKRVIERDADPQVRDLAQKRFHEVRAELGMV